MPIKFPDDVKKRIDHAIAEHWRSEYDEDIGLLKIDSIYRFFTGLIGAAAYNQGVADAQTYLRAKLIDLEIDLHEDVRYRDEDSGRR